MSKDKNKQLRRKVRALYFVSTVSIALVLFLLGTLGYLILNAVKATDSVKESLTVNVMLKDDISKGLADSIGVDLRAIEGVREALFVSREQAAKEFQQYIGEDFEEFLGANPLPDSYRIGMTADASTKEAVEALEKEVLTWPGVDEVVYQKSVVEQIASNIQKFLVVLLLFGGTLLLISVVLLRNTIRAAIYSKRYIINTMKLVGATSGFILRPFLLESVLQGLMAGLAATLLFLAMVAGLKEGLPNMTLMLENTKLVLIVAAMFVGGVLISVIFTTLSVRKFINMKTSQIHMF